MVTKAATLTKGRHSKFFVHVVSFALIVITTWAGRGPSSVVTRSADAVPVRQP
jgi:hypothetical protein